MAKRKKNPTNNEYPTAMKQEVILWRAQGKSYTEISAMAKKKFGVKKIPKATLSKWFRCKDTKVNEVNLTPNSNAMAQSKPGGELTETKIINTIKSREQALGILEKYLVQVDELQGIPLDEKYKQVRAFIYSVVGVCDSLDKAKNLMPNIEVKGNLTMNQANFNLNNITLSDLDALPRQAAEALRFWLKTNLCQACPAMARYNEIKEVKP